MEFNRRDLLKFFGAGTVIAPLAGAAPLARLIEIPKLEIVEATKLPEPLDLAKITRFDIVCHMEDGSTRIVHGGTLFKGTGKVIPTDRLAVDLWFAKRNSSSPDSLLNQGFLASEVYL